MSLPERIDVAILGAVRLEVDNLAGLLGDSRVVHLAGETFTVGKIRGGVVLVGPTGLGKVNAAITTTALLQSSKVGQVWNIGCAGCYREGPLHVGDVLVSRQVLLADEGVLTATGTLSTREIGIPVLRAQEELFFDSLPAGPLIDRLQEDIPAGRYHVSAKAPVTAVAWPGRDEPPAPPSFHLAYGPSLCVGMASGDFAVASQRFAQYRAFAENMEGSAVAQACFRFSTPFVECRGMSNRAGDRDKQNWRLEKALVHCQAIVMNWLLAQWMR